MGIFLGDCSDCEKYKRLYEKKVAPQRRHIQNTAVTKSES